MSKKSYQKKPAKAKKNKLEDVVKERQLRWEKAKNAFPIDVLAKKLGLYVDGEYVCPKCQARGLKVFAKKSLFICQSCKRKGHQLLLVKDHIKSTNWGAIYHIESLLTEKSSSPVKSEIQEVLPELKTIEKKLQPEELPIDKEEITRIKEQVDLLQVVKSLGVNVKKCGKDYVGRCPFHDDNKPSFTVSSNQLWNCFGCQKGGSVIDFVMEMKSLDFVNAVKFIQEKYHCSYTVKSPKSNIKSDTAILLDPEYQKLARKVIEHYHERLKHSREAMHYLESRGIASREIVGEFLLGFADGTLPKMLQGRDKATLETRKKLQEIGLLRSSSGTEHFVGCIVVPIIDENGIITEVYARRIVDKSKAALHLYLPGKHIGIFNSKCLQGKEVILCEAIFDALTFWRHGFYYVTSCYGVQGFGKEMLQKIASSNVEKVYIAFDADMAGDDAATKVASKLNKYNIECWRLVLPKNMDINSYAQNSSEPQKQLRSLMKQAMRIGKVIHASSSSLAVEEKKDTAKKKNSFPIEITDEEIRITFSDRKYRIRGFQRNLSYDSIRVNVRVSMTDKMHVDTFDLYNARQRSGFIKVSGHELDVDHEIIKRDIVRILAKLEELQEQNIREKTKGKKQEVILTEEEKQQALSLLQTPNLVDKIQKDFARCGLVGEEMNILVTYLSLTSRKLDDPLAIIVQAISSAGKTSLMNTALSFIPEEEQVKYTAMTGQSLFYMGEEDLVHKVLAISEEEGAEKASYAIKIMQSEKSLCIASTGKDPKSGRFHTHEYKVKGPTQIILTTTSIEIDEELQNRCIVITVNDSREQTSAIHSIQRKLQTLNGMMMQKEKSHITKLHQNAQRLLKPMMVVNPYAEKLTFLNTRPRTRRDHVKYLTLIRAIALLHQYQRPIKHIKHRNKSYPYIEVELSDIKVANKIVNEIMGASLDELAPQTRRFLQLMVKMVDDHCEKEGIDASDYHFTRREIRFHTGWSDFQVRTHLRKLLDFEYLLAHRGKQGSQYVYELLYRGEGQDGNSFVMGLVDIDKLINRVGLEPTSSIENDTSSMG